MRDSAANINQGKWFILILLWHLLSIGKCTWAIINHWGSDAYICMAKPGGHYKNAYKLFNQRDLKMSTLIEIASLKAWVRYFVWNFKDTLWNSTQNILLIHWKMCILFAGENCLQILELLSIFEMPPRSLSAHIMACTLFSTLSEPMVTYWQFDHGEQISVKFKSKYNNFHIK